MCNTVVIHYSCNHYAQFHRSTCRSIFWVTKRISKPKPNSSSKTSIKDTRSNSNDPPRGRTRQRTSSKNTTRTPSSTTTPPSSAPSKSPNTISKAACKSFSDIILRGNHPCGPCQSSSSSIYSLFRISANPTSRDFPSVKRRKHLKRGEKVTGGSPLKHELTAEELRRDDGQEVNEKVRSSKRTFEGVTKLLRIEPARFWRSWRRFDDLGRRGVGCVKSS